MISKTGFTCWCKPIQKHVRPFISGAACWSFAAWARWLLTPFCLKTNGHTSKKTISTWIYIYMIIMIIREWKLWQPKHGRFMIERMLCCRRARWTPLFSVNIHLSSIPYPVAFGNRCFNLKRTIIAQWQRSDLQLNILMILLLLLLLVPNILRIIPPNHTPGIQA